MSQVIAEARVTEPAGLPVEDELPRSTKPATAHNTNSSAYAMAFAFLALTIALSLIWSHARLMGNDEFLSFYTDSVPSAARVIDVQLHHPISLDPPTYHLLSHLSMDIFGANAMSLRLPALAGFLLLQLSLFLLVRRLAGTRAAVVAMALPLLTASFRYSVEGRPYGLLLGLYAFALVCWQSATDPEKPSRILTLAALTLTLALAITSHYFGVLILIPVALGELARTLHRRRLDFAVLTSLTLGLASIALILPFQRALMVYRRHYYIKGVNWHDITQGYRELFIRYTTWPMPLQKLAAAAMALATLALAVAAYRRFKQRDPAAEPAHLWIAIAATALLPFFGYLFGRFVTHTMEVRYVIAALIAFAATLAIVLAPKLRRDTVYYTLLAAIAVSAITLQGSGIAQERRDTRTLLASFQLTPEAEAAVNTDPTQKIYVQTLNDFFLNSFYAAPALRPRFSMIYGQAEEIRWRAHDTNSITAINMQNFTPLSTTSYENFLHQPAPLLELHRSDWEWVGLDIADRHLPLTSFGPFMRGELVKVDTTTH